MACSECGAADEGLHYRCSYCDGEYCSSHRLPEGHDCDGVRFLSDAGKRFESKFSGEVVKNGEGIRSPEPFKPEYTVGNTPEWEGDPSPDTVLKEDLEPEEPEEPTGLLGRLLRRWA